MGFKQPRVPEYREADGVGRFLQRLTLFLKDFCMDSWKATMNLQKEAGLDRADAGAFVLKYVYPVGSIYATMGAASPKELFGGEWERIEGRFLLGAGDAHPLGETGGSESVALKEAQMPQHRHVETLHVSGVGYGFMPGDELSSAAGDTVYSFTESLLEARTDTGSLMGTRTAGSGEAHENMPPYLSVNLWRRTG